MTPQQVSDNLDRDCYKKVIINNTIVRLYKKYDEIYIPHQYVDDLIGIPKGTMRTKICQGDVEKVIGKLTKIDSLFKGNIGKNNCISQSQISKYVNTYSRRSEKENQHIISELEKAVDERNEGDVMKSKIVFITPELAKEMLTHNVNNRNIKKQKLEFLVEDMKNGKFFSNGESICFDVEGNLRDGQHRLMAIVESGCGQMINVVYDIPIEQANLYDIGATRSTSDCIKFGMFSEISDISNSKIGALTTFLIRHKKGSRSAVSHSEKIEYMKDHYEQLLEVKEIILSKNCQKVSTAGTHAAIYVALINGIDKNKLKCFYEIAVSGFAQSEKDYPIIAFRNKVISVKGGGAEIQEDTYFRAQYAIYNYDKELCICKSFNNGKEYFTYEI